jgi:UDPglucose--hexose-1-phosphate uridylyltransferase
MAEYRFNAATGDWVVVSRGRRQRPGAMTGRERPDLPSYSPDCPFCPGNEAMTPEIILQVPAEAPGEAWKMRCFPNKFPVVSPDAGEGAPAPTETALPAVGIHEVIVETPLHNEQLVDRDLTSFEEMVRVYQQRLLALASMPTMNYFLLSKNHGPESGASLEHPHSQVLATSIVPAAVERRWAVAGASHRETGSCLYCEMASREADEGSRLVWQDDALVAFTPYASAFPGELWILPRRHAPSFVATSDGDLSLFAGLLRRCLFALLDVFEEPDFNYVIHTAPRGLEEAPYCHWSLQLLPRLARLGGLELGTGVFVNSFPPEDVAPLLRESIRTRGLE